MSTMTTLMEFEDSRKTQKYVFLLLFLLINGVINDQKITLQVLEQSGKMRS